MQDILNQFNQGVFQREQFTRIVMEGEGSLLWTITDPARRLLEGSLNANTSVPLELIFKWTITRLSVLSLVQWICVCTAFIMMSFCLQSCGQFQNCGQSLFLATVCSVV